MRRAAVGALCLAMLSTAAPQAAVACGDKLVVFGRGVRFERLNLATHPGTVLVFMNPESDLPKAEREFQFSAALELAGHTVHAVTSRAELLSALEANPSALVLTALSDAQALWREGSVTGGPGILPVLYKPTKEELARARELSPCLAQAAKRKGRKLTELVDEMMGVYEEQGSTDCRAAPRVES